MISKPNGWIIAHTFRYIGRAYTLALSSISKHVAYSVYLQVSRTLLCLARGEEDLNQTFLTEGLVISLIAHNMILYFVYQYLLLHLLASPNQPDYFSCRSPTYIAPS